MRCKFPSKSRAHWLSEQVATVIKCPMREFDPVSARDCRRCVDVIHATNKENHNKHESRSDHFNFFSKQLSNMATKVQKIMVQPIKSKVQIWLYEQLDQRIEGRIIVHCSFHFILFVQHFVIFNGFDEFMNLVLDDAEEVNAKKNTRKTLGRILLKGDNITLIQAL
ncbi:hypothetical protein BC937DRAFT_86217, partial [Endogone sp. FLAS-F59071]